MISAMSDDQAGRKSGWKVQITLIVLLVYLHVLLEWLFYITKPSFMDKMGLLEKIQILLVSPIPPVIIGTLAMFLCFLPFIITKNAFVLRICSTTASIITTLVLVAISLLLVDNFTYTVLHFGVRNVSGVGLAAYWLLMLILAFIFYVELPNLKKMFSGKYSFRAVVTLVLGLILVSIVFIATSVDKSQLENLKWNERSLSLENPPNIIILSSDGLDARHMSVYGYERKTTPYLDKISQDLLLCENCFTNADASSASIASMFTGKLPTRTRLMFPPQILEGDDAYQHLPGELRKYGFRNSDISTRHHADPIDMNMLNSFHWANRREIERDNLEVLSQALLGDKSVYFINAMRERITIRFLHVFNMQHMRDPMAELGTTGRRYNWDKERIKDLFTIIDSSHSPFFVHVHLLGTHGPLFRLSNRVFSANKKETDPWMTDFYDDSILGFDGFIEELMQKLKESNVSHNTIVVICTDHGPRWTVDVRVPLMFIFPDGKHKRRIKANVQNLDIAPTILDYMDIAQPEWMGGMSLLSSDVDSRRFIFTATRERGLVTQKKYGKQLDIRKISPPFYSIGSVGIFYHQKYYKLLLRESILTISDMEGHTAPCREDDLPDPQKIGQMIIDHLEENGFDTSSIKTPLNIEIME